MASLATPETPSPDALANLKAPVNPRRGLESGWVWMAIACVMMALSGIARVVQDRQFGLIQSSVPPAPFPMKAIPTQIGEWSSIEDADIKLDPLTVRITGSTDHIQRNYLDRRTGTLLSLLVLYGPAEPVAPHTPEACYPATGYTPEGRASGFDLPLNGETARFRQAIYTKPGIGQPERANVYYSFRLDGNWAPDIAIGKRFHRTNAGIIKVQIQRRMGPYEVSKRGIEPVEEFLAQLIPEIETLIAAKASHPNQSVSR